MKPLLSIIIPVYNVENYIDDCIESVLTQNYKNYEIILIDNASTDRSGKICDSYASKHYNIKVIHLETNSLPAGARNAGLKVAIGEYIHFCDSDDYYLNNSFERIADILRTSSPTVLMGQFVSIPEKGAFVCNDVQLDLEAFKQDNPIDIVQYLLGIPNLLCTTWRFIVKREFLELNNILFPEGCHSEDEEWVPKVLCSGEKFALLQEKFYCYRPRAIGSITSTKKFINSKSKLIVAINLLQFLHEKKYEDVRRDFIYSRVNMLLGIFSTRCDTFTHEQINELADIIERNLDIFQTLNKMTYKCDLYDFVINYGPYEGVYLYCENVIKKTLHLVLGKENKNIYIFPTGNNGESTSRILQNAGYNVKGFLDNSHSKNGCNIDGLPVTLPNVLKKMSLHELKNIFVVVTVQQKQVSETIMNQLREYGLDSSQFASRIY